MRIKKPYFTTEQAREVSGRACTFSVTPPVRQHWLRRERCGWAGAPPGVESQAGQCGSWRTAPAACNQIDTFPKAQYNEP